MGTNPSLVSPRMPFYVPFTNEDSAVLFSLFEIGMAGSSIQFALRNSTTIENLSGRATVWYLAVHINRPDLLPS